MKDTVYVIMARDNFYNPDDDYILTATTDKKLAERYLKHYEKHNPEGACSIIQFEGGLRLGALL